MSCGCECEKCGAGECPFEGSSILGGRFYPRRMFKELRLTTTAGQQTYPLELLADVTMTMYVTVISGVLDCFDTQIADDARPGEDAPHMRFVADAGPVEVVLPPGEHRFVFAYGNSAACTASIYLIDREARK